MANAPDENGFTASRLKGWLSRQPWTWTAAGTFMGLLAGVFFLLSAMAEFRNGERAVGAGYLVLMALFPPAITLTGWLSGREESLLPGKAGAAGRGKWLARLGSPVDCGPMTPLVLLVAGTGLGAGLMVLITGKP